jgi:hypothetical protein
LVIGLLKAETSGYCIGLSLEISVETLGDVILIKYRENMAWISLLGFAFH